MDNSNHDDESFEHLKDMLLHLKPIIKMSGNSEATKEMLPHLSEIDPLFHQLKLVKELRKNLRDNLSNDVEKAIEEYLLENKGQTRAEPPVEHLVKLISEKFSFNNLSTRYDYEIDKNIKYISHLGEYSFFEQILEKDILNNKDSPIHSCEYSLNSSLNQSGFLFLHPSQYNVIAKKLQGKDSIEDIHNALNMLLVVTPGEPVSQEAWIMIKKSLKKLLLNSDDIIFNKVLRIHTKLLASQIHSVVIEGYINLLEAIAYFWLSRKQFKNLPDITKGINLKNGKLMVLISILLKFMKEFSLVWVRYPSKYMIEVIDQTLSLFLTSISPDKMSALDILSIADPQASWLHCWMHGRLGRQKVCEALSSKMSLVFSLLSNCISYLENTECQQAELYSEGRLTCNELRFLIFSHNFHFIVKLLHHVDGVGLFPIADPLTQHHISVKKFMNFIQIPFVNENKILMFTILNHLTKTSLFNETICRIICDSGFADFLASTALYKNISKTNVWYYELVVKFFLSLNNTTIGHKYILLGTLQRISLATLVTNHDGAIGRDLCSLAENLLMNDPSENLTEKSVGLCLEILFSPLGKYLYYNHSLMPSVIEVLKDCCKKNENLTSLSSLFLEDKAFFIILKALIHCYEGIIFLDKNIFLEPVLTHLIPHFADKGQIKTRLLNSLTSSRIGAKLLADHSVIQPFWVLIPVMIKNELTNKVISLEEDKEQLFAKALLPLTCLASSYEGTVQLFSENGIIDVLNSFLREEDQDNDIKKILFYLLCSATSTLDKMILMEKKFDLQKKVVAIGMANFDDELCISHIDDNSVLANHIISSCTFPKGVKSNTLPFFSKVFSKNTESFTTRKEVTNGNSQGTTTRSKDIWKFLSNTESRSQNHSGIMHCRRTYRLEIAANNFFKISTFLDIIEFTINNLRNSSENLLPEELLANCHSLELNSDCEHIPSSEYDSETSLKNLSIETDVNSCSCSSYKLAADFMCRYAVELNLLQETSNQKWNIVKLSRSVHSNLLDNNYTKTDWLSLLFYIMSGGSIERTWNIMQCLRSLRVGTIIWPSLYPSLVKKGPPHAMLYAGVIQAVKLLLYRDAPDVYVAYEVFTYL